MRYMYVLKPGYLAMARAEVEALEPWAVRGKLLGNVLLASSDRDLAPRLALTRSVHRHVFTSTPEGLYDAIRENDWTAQKGESFYVDVHRTDPALAPDVTAKKVADELAPLLGDPRVDVDDPQTRVDVFITADAVIVGTHGQFIHQDYERRKAHNRPAHHPTSLHPMMARACVNLTGAWAECVTDPMCGSGGFLIEAGLMGLCCKGMDVDERMIDRARTNLAFFGVNASLGVEDATRLDEPLDCVVTDLPYGKSTGRVDRDALYPAFLAALKRVLQVRAVVVFPDDVDFQKLVDDAGLTVLGVFDLYVHKSLTRKIVVIVP